jgi:hypothetical protein
VGTNIQQVFSSSSSFSSSIHRSRFSRTRDEPSPLHFAAPGNENEDDLSGRLCACQQMLCSAKCLGMETNWAVEQLQTIRTLMERSAVYRRALAPIMLFAGLTGLATMGLGLYLNISSSRGFCGLWLGAAAVAVTGAFLLARQQAIKDREPFWSPPTRRVTLALLPPLLAGLSLGLLLLVFPHGIEPMISLMWILFYGCALHAAGFFMPRGIKWFGWIFILGACGLFYALMLNWIKFEVNPHWLMGFFFGVLQLAYGAYLYLTEKGKNAA